ncbi:alpha/beta fold hydrolase [Streptomyces sp. NBC_01497]|uniref:alpha/beta fold hydrolase n=1 Tax=Streptomyces sp. NBC_01497 TaxID=2903885 RepID=UPI002E3198AA|nr:alpha/beta fold hydrolase [Streptomyces sp. NBC_01497]
MTGAPHESLPQPLPPAGDAVPAGTVPGGAAHPALAVVRAPAQVTSAVLVLHGGRAVDPSPARARHLASLRMRPFLRALARGLPPDGVLLGRVRYRRRGWNEDAADPLRDTLAALDELVRRHGHDVRVVLVGHSMGGRAALRAAGHPAVHAVVALAPWCPPGEPVRQLAGVKVLFAHGDQDRVTDPAASLGMALKARADGGETAALVLDGAGHAMLARASVWHRTTTGTVRGLLGLAPLPDVVRAAFGAPAALHL